MVRALLRLLAMVALSVSIIMAVLDATRSIAAEAIALTPLGVSWASASPATLEQFELLVTGGMPAFAWETVVAGLLGLPGFAVFAVLALLFYLTGGRARQPARHFAPQR